MRQGGEQGDGQQTVVGYDAEAEELFVDRGNSGITGFSQDFPGKHAAPMKKPDGPVRMHVFVDRSSIEVFADEGKTVITDRIFPEEGSAELEPYAKGGRALLASLEVYELDSVWRR